VPKGVMIVESRPSAAEREAEFDEWYRHVHVPEVRAVPGIVAVRRYRMRPRGAPGVTTELPTYLAVYDLEADDLEAPLRELARRSAEGRSTPSGAMEREPPPKVTLFELLDEA